MGRSVKSTDLSAVVLYLPTYLPTYIHTYQQDVGLAKRRAECQKGVTSKAQLEIAALQYEIDMLKKASEEHAR